MNRMTIAACWAEGTSLTRLFLVVVGAVAVYAMVTFVVWLFSKHRKHGELKGEVTHPTWEPTWDPALCTHRWKEYDSGSCENTYSSYGGGVDLQTWTVERCARCGIKRFSCTDTSCTCYEECRQTHEEGSPEPGPIERVPMGKVADKNGFEYAQYSLRDKYGNELTAYCFLVPTTYRFTCPDCGGMVEGVDAQRIWPLGVGPFPTAYRCENCGRQETYDFGVPRIEVREGEPSFKEPEGMQPVCPSGGKHEWELINTWTDMEMPEGVDPCLENMSLLEEVTYRQWRCTKCGEEKID